MDVFEAIHTTRAMRRLDPSRPVAEADLHKIVEAGTKAATGKNSQPVRWIVVTDPDVKRRLGDLYQRCSTKLLEGDADSLLSRSSLHLAEHLGESPALLIACTQGERKRPASVFPAVQNVMLAARALGLGTTLTTSHLEEEDEVGQILELPSDVVTYCMIPVGYPLGRWGEAPRAPVEEVTFRDRWGNAFRVEP